MIGHKSFSTYIYSIFFKIYKLILWTTFLLYECSTNFYVTIIYIYIYRLARKVILNLSLYYWTNISLTGLLMSNLTNDCPKAKP